MQTRAKCSVVVAELRHTQYMHFHMFLSISVLSDIYQSLFVIFDPDSHLMLGSASRVTVHTIYAFSYVSINFSVIGHIPVTFRHIRSILTPNAWFCKQSEVTHSICIFMCFYQFQCYRTQNSHFSSESMQTRPKRSVVVPEWRYT